MIKIKESIDENVYGKVILSKKELSHAKMLQKEARAAALLGKKEKEKFFKSNKVQEAIDNNIITKVDRGSLDIEPLGKNLVSSIYALRKVDNVSRKDFMDHYQNKLLLFIYTGNIYCPKCNKLKKFENFEGEVECCGVTEIVINKTTKTLDFEILKYKEEEKMKEELQVQTVKFVTCEFDRISENIIYIKARSNVNNERTKIILEDGSTMILNQRVAVKSYYNLNSGEKLKNTKIEQIIYLWDKEMIEEAYDLNLFFNVDASINLSEENKLNKDNYEDIFAIHDYLRNRDDNISHYNYKSVIDLCQALKDIQDFYNIDTLEGNVDNDGYHNSTVLLKLFLYLKKYNMNYKDLMEKKYSKLVFKFDIIKDSNIYSLINILEKIDNNEINIDNPIIFRNSNEFSNWMNWVFYSKPEIYNHPYSTRMHRYSFDEISLEETKYLFEIEPKFALKANKKFNLFFCIDENGDIKFYWYKPIEDMRNYINKYGDNSIKNLAKKVSIKKLTNNNINLSIYLDKLENWYLIFKLFSVANSWGSRDFEYDIVENLDKINAMSKEDLFLALKTIHIEGLNFKFLFDFFDLKEEAEDLFPELRGRRVVWKRIILEHDYYLQRRREGKIDMTSIFKDRYEKFKPFKLQAQGKKYFVEAPLEVKDLIKEGQMQQHCMDTYGKHLEAGTELILFIREKRGEPLYAASLDEYGNITQSSGKAHSLVPEEILLALQERFQTEEDKKMCLKHFFKDKKN